MYLGLWNERRTIGTCLRVAAALVLLVHVKTEESNTRNWVSAVKACRLKCKWISISGRRALKLCQTMEMWDCCLCNNLNAFYWYLSWQVLGLSDTVYWIFTINLLVNLWCFYVTNAFSKWLLSGLAAFSCLLIQESIRFTHFQNSSVQIFCFSWIKHSYNLYFSIKKERK